MTRKVSWLIVGFAFVSVALSAPPALAASELSTGPDVVIGEADGGVDVPVRLSAASANTVTVAFATAGVTAGSGFGCNNDFTGTSGTLTYAPGETSKTVHVPIFNCSDVELIESFTLGLSTPVNATIARASTRISIVDNDTIVATPRVYARDATVDERDGVALVPVLLGGPRGQASNSTVSVDFAAPGATGTLTFAPGQTVKTVAVPIADDADPALSERLAFTLSNATNATIVNGTSTIWIGTSDTPASTQPAISAPPDLVVGEGDGYVDLPVRLNTPGTEPVAVSYAAAGSTAGSGFGCNNDYVSVSGTLNFAAGETTKVVRVELSDCNDVELIESFTLNLSTAVNAAIARASARISIVDNDTAVATPRLYARDAIVDEKDGYALVPVVLGGPRGQVSNSVVTVDYSAPGVNGTLTFGPGQTVRTVALPISDDPAAEPVERFALTLSNPANATIVNGTSTIWTGGSDTPPSSQPAISAPPDLVVGEGDGYVDLPVRLNTPGTEPVAVNYNTAASTAGSGFGCNNDYVGSTGTLNFAPGETTKTVRIELSDCDDIERLESFTLNLSAAVNAVIVRTGARISIVNNDTAVETPKLFARDVTVDEKDGYAFVPVLLGGPRSEASNSVVTVDYAAPGATGTLTFAPGQTVKLVAVPITDDVLAEPDETSALTLSNPSNATLGDATGAITIAANDGTAGTQPAILAPPDVLVGERDGYVDLAVRLAAPGTERVSVDFVTSEQTAGSGFGCNNDYVAASGALRFAPGETVKTVRVEISDCDNAESLESFLLTLSAAVNGTIARTTTRVSILDGNTTLSSIAVTPSNPAVPAGSDQPFTATGTFSDATTLNITSTVAWSSSVPAVATISAAGVAHGVAVGTSTIKAELGAVTGSTVLTVTAPQPVAQTITFAALGGRTFGTADFSVAATASSGLPVTFGATGSCVIAGSTVHLTGAGTCTVTASQPGNTAYLPAAAVARTFAIAKAAQSIAFGDLSDRTLASGAFDVSATATSGLAVMFTTTGTCSVSGTRVLPTGAGTCTVRATQDGNGDYLPATPVSRAFTVSSPPAITATPTATVSPTPTPSPTATPTPTVTPTPLPTPGPKVRCTVPNLAGRTLAAAKTALARGHCRTGTVSRAYSRKVKKGRIVSASRKAGKVFAAETKVNLVVSRGPRRR